MKDTQNDYQKLREVIIAANPEIMEWRCEGCNQKYGEYVNGCVFCWREQISPEENRKLFPERAVRLTPREIRLADVLLALGAKDYEISLGGRLAVFFKGNKRQFDWKLHDNDLDLQFEETKQFLINLLLKNKTMTT